MSRNTRILGVQIKDSDVTTLQLANAAVTSDKLATDSVITVKILDANVTEAKLATNSVSTNKIVDLNVTSGKLAADSVITSKILDSNVTAAKLAADSVTTVKILDSNVTEPKLDIFNAPTTGYFLKWNGTKLEYADVTTGAVSEADIVFNEVANETPDGIEVEFTHDFEAANGTVMLTLNGLLQQPGVGKDYEYDAPTMTATFVTAPETGDIILFNYVKAD